MRCGGVSVLVRFITYLVGVLMIIRVIVLRLMVVLRRDLVVRLCRRWCRMLVRLRLGIMRW